MKSIPHLFTLILAMCTLCTQRLSATVTVFGEASSSGPLIYVKVFADIPDEALLSFGIRVLYEPGNLSVEAAFKNTSVWYFSNETSQVSYLDPYIVTPGEVLILGGKLDAYKPLKGVAGNHVLLGTVIFGRLNNDKPQFKLGLGRKISYANFVTTAGGVLDQTGVVFKEILPDPNDQDIDGLPDTWEIKRLGNSDKYTWNDDPDGDGFDNLTEYQADTDPTDKNSYLQIQEIASGVGNVSIKWIGGEEATQYLQRALSLDPSELRWFDIFTNPPPTPITNYYNHSPGSNKQGYYRIRAGRALK